MIKAVIFDYFGVICSDDYWQFVKADRHSNTVYREYAEQVNKGQLHWQSFVDKVAKATGKSSQTVSNMYENETVNPMVVGLIAQLKGRYKTGLITNAHHEFIDRMLKRHHLKELFDVLVISSRLGVIKPNPTIFNEALDRLNIKPNEAVYIDDLERHVNAARSLGMHAILYQNFGQLNQDLKQILVLAANSKN